MHRDHIGAIDVCNGKWMNPLVPIAVCIYCDHNDSWRRSIAAILGEDVAFTRPSLQRVDRKQRVRLYTTRDEVEVTESDTGQHSEKVQQRSSLA